MIKVLRSLVEVRSESQTKAQRYVEDKDHPVLGNGSRERERVEGSGTGRVASGKNPHAKG